MLPPFVPPLARASIPDITDFCIQVEQPFVFQTVQEDCLPPITDYFFTSITSSPPVLLSNDIWLEEERDAFDWQSLALLATKQREDQQNDEEDTASWKRPTGSAAEYVATVLMQVARRVRAGELKIEAAPGIRTEAALAATLAALLKE